MKRYLRRRTTCSPPLSSLVSQPDAWTPPTTNGAGSFSPTATKSNGVKR